MKLIIDIPEKLYSTCNNIGIKSDEQIAIANGIPLDSVIENIKAEIEQKAKEREFYLDIGHPHDGLYEAIEIIDKHITESSNIQSIRTKGKWLSGMYDTCSCCGAKLHDIYISSDVIDFINVALFCPHCGADMRGITNDK